MTLIASLGVEGIGAAMSVEGATDGAAFETYVEHFLAPTPKRGQIAVMDNLQVHKMKRVRELIEGVGAEVLFLPPYSPDFSPIEETFSKVKGILRRIGARTRESLLEATSEALGAVSRREMPSVGSDIAATRSPITRYENRSSLRYPNARSKAERR